MATTVVNLPSIPQEINPETERQNLIIEHMSLVRYIARRIAQRLPSSVEEDDLFEAGILGLIDAIDKFDPRKKVKFKTYAEHRIRGAILDSLRALDWVPRSLRQKASMMEQATHAVAQTKGASPTAEQITDYLDISIESYHRIRSQCDNLTLVSLENSYWENANGESKTLMEMIPDSRQEHPALSIDHKTIRILLAQEIEKLPYKARTVLYLYYYEEHNMKTIGNILGITESRVSQIHSQALKLLKRRLKSILDL